MWKMSSHANSYKVNSGYSGYPNYAFNTGPGAPQEMTEYNRKQNGSTSSISGSYVQHQRNPSMAYNGQVRMQNNVDKRSS